MEMSEIQSRLEAVFRDVFDEPGLKLERSLTAGEIEAWDSISHISLLAAVEKEFGFRFLLGEVRHLENVGELLDLIARKTG